MSEFKAAIFDLDDTLLKTAEIKWAQHKAVAKHFYGIDLTDEVLREHWGKPFDELIGHLYNHSDTVENMRAANRSTESDFPKAIQFDTLHTTTRLRARGILLGIITSIHTDFAKKDLEIVNVPTDHFLFIHGADATDYHKPDPRVFNAAADLLAQYKIAREETVYIGDALMDYQAARDARLGFIGIAAGFVSLEAFRQEGALAVSTLSEAADLITA